MYERRVAPDFLPKFQQSNAGRVVTLMNSVRVLAGSFTSTVFVFSLNLLIGVVLARTLSVDARGEYGSLILLTQIGVSLTLLSVGDGLVSIVNRDGVDRRAGIGAALSAFFILAPCSILGVAIVVYLQFGDFSVAKPLYVLSLIGVIVFAQMFIGLSRAYADFSSLNIERVVSQLCFLALIFFFSLFLSHLDVNLVILCFVASRSPLLLFWCFRWSKVGVGVIRWNDATKLIRAGVSYHPIHIGGLLSSQADKLLITLFCDLKSVAFYLVASGLAGAVSGMFTQTLSLVAFPILSRNRDAIDLELVSTIIRVAMIFSALMLVALMASVRPLIVGLYGDDYLAAVSAGYWVVFGGSLAVIRTTLSEIAKGVGLQSRAAEGALISVACTCCLFFLLPFSPIPNVTIGMFIGALVACIYISYRLRVVGLISRVSSLVPGKKDFLLFHRLFFKSIRSRF